MSLDKHLAEYDRDQLLEEYRRLQEYYAKKEELHRIRFQELKRLRHKYDLLFVAYEHLLDERNTRNES